MTPKRRQPFMPLLLHVARNDLITRLSVIPMNKNRFRPVESSLIGKINFTLCLTPDETVLKSADFLNVMISLLKIYDRKLFKLGVKMLN